MDNYLKELIDRSIPTSIERLKEFCALPSISAQKMMIPETVDYLKELIEQLGGQGLVLDECPGSNPVLLATFEAGPNGNPNKTLLFYNHYDVQPPEPLEEWDSVPFELTECDGKLFARGVADNKGDLMARLTAVEVLQQLDGGLPCTVKFLIEGEEEIGSPNLAVYLKNYQHLLQADACIWEHADRDEKDRVQLMAGVKGMAYMELTCESADMDLHSKLGAIVDNAAWRLNHALSSMKNNKNEILVEGFYDGITPPTEIEKSYIEKIPFDEEAIRVLYGLRQPFISENPNEALVLNPTMTICGFESGYYGEGSKTVLPKKAIAKLDCRLVPGQDPNHIFQCVQSHLVKNGYTDVKVKLLNGVPPYRSDLSHPFVSLMVSTAEEVYQTEVVLSPNNAGTGPMADFGNLLQIPIVSTGVGWVNSRLHAPNESIRISDYVVGIEHIAHIIKEFA